MSTQTLGTCSICGGRVTVPLVWWGIIPPEPTCQSCGAHAKDHGPVIDMTPSRTITTTGTEPVDWSKYGQR